MKMVVHKTVTILLQGVKDFGLRIVQSKVLRFCFKYIISSHLSHSVLRRATSVNNFHRAGRGGGYLRVQRANPILSPSSTHELGF